MNTTATAQSDTEPEGTPEKKPEEKPEENLSSSTVRCPVDGHEGEGCRELCIPFEGIGLCGREAPHGNKKKRQ